MVHVDQELHVETAVPSSEDNLDLDLNNNKPGKEMPHKVQNKNKENRKVVIRKKHVEKSQPLNLKINKNEVYSEQGQVLSKGKSSKDLRILDSKIRENEEALLTFIERSSDLSDSTVSSDSNLEDLVELK